MSEPLQDREVRTLVQLELLGGDTLFERLPAAAAVELLARHDRLVRDLLERFGGREVEKSRRFLLLFERPLDATRYGLAYHRAVAALAAELGRPLAGRIGIHLGEVFLRRNPSEDVRRGAKPLEVEGPSRTTAARLMSLAAGGQTLLTRAAYDLARRAAVDLPELSGDELWRSHGAYRFGGVEQVLDVFEVGPEAGAGESALDARLPPPLEPRRATRVAREGAGEWTPAAGEPIPHRPHWTLERPLARTDGGEVWLGKHKKTGDRRVFRFATDAGDLRRQLAAARRLREQLDREVAPRLLDSHLDEPPYYLESELAGGTALATWTEGHGGAGEVPLAVRLEIAAGLAGVLAAVHGAGVAVGDLRPRSVRVRERAGGDVEVLLSDLSRASIDAGKPGDAAREEDVRAFGVLLYQLLAGDLERPLGAFWERDVDGEALRREIAALADPDPAARPRDLAAVAARLRARADPGGPPAEDPEPKSGWFERLRRRGQVRES